MRFPWQPRPVLTIEALALAHDDVVRLFARTILNLQIRAANTEQDMRPLIGRVDLLEGEDNSTMGSPRGESFKQIHNQLGQLKQQVAALRDREREAAVGL